MLAGTLVAFELISGTFYLLLLSFGLVAGAVCAHMGCSTVVQIVIASIFGGGSVIMGRRYKRTQPSELPANENGNVNLDIGETVWVTAWQPDGTSTVKYRGANWSVAVLDDSAPPAGKYCIVKVIGSRLMLKRL